MRKSEWGKILILSFLLSLNYIGFSQVYQVNGDAVDFGNGLVRLTSSTPAKGAGVWQTASAWSTTQHDLTKPFDMTFNLFFGCESGPNGGDGITFTFQNKGLNALGAGGGFLGIGGSPAESINQAISIEFDTYDASAFGASNEIPADHIAIDINGDVNGTTNTFQGTSGMTTVQAVYNNRDLESCAQNANDYYTIRIVWNPTAHTLQLYEEGVLTMTYTNDLVTNIFGGNANVYWGFTSATGSASNEQWVAPEGTVIPWECTSGTSCCAPFTLTPTGPTTICNNPITIGIAGTYNSYKWSTGETTSSIDVSAPGSYIVTVLQDQFGTMCPSVDTIEILPTGPTAVLSGGATLCNDGSTATLSVSLNGSSPWSLTYAKDGVEQPPITGITSSPYIIQGSATHKYTLVSVVDNGACPGVVSGTANVNSFAGLPIGHDTTFLAPGTANLKVDNKGGTYDWYETSTGGSPVFTGADFTTPTLTGTTTYYVVNSALPAFTTKSVALLNQAEGNGPAPNDKNDGGLPKADLWLNFTANSNFTFDTVTCAINVVLPWSASKVSVTIQDITAGTSITKDSLVNTALPSGNQNFYMPLHYNCIAGHSYNISYEGQTTTGGLGGSIKGIMYWQLVASYPITTDPEVTITGSGAPATRYPGLFDWKISYGSSASACGRTPVTAYPCPKGTLSGTTSICNDGVSTATITVDLEGQAPWNFTYSIDGVAQAPVKGISQDPYTFQSLTGAHVYTLTSVTNSNSRGCINNYSGTATIDLFNNFPVGHNAMFVSPGSATLSVDDNGGTYQWYDALNGGNLVHTGTNFTTPVLTGETTYYVVDINAVANCGRTPVTAFPCPNGALTGDAIICDDGISTTTLSVNLEGASPWTISYSIDGITQTPVTGITQNPYTFQSLPGAHVYVLTSVSTNNSNGCTGNFSGTATVTIFQDNLVGHDTTFISPGSATVRVVDNGGVYQWYDAPTGGNLVHTGAIFTTPVLSDTVTYYVEDINATTNCGRTPVSAFPIEVNIKIMIPNLITPNNDGQNDSFVIIGLPKHSDLTIYNRWGKNIYQSPNYDNQWKANDTADGTYYYDLVLPDGKSYKGWLNIVR